MSNLIKQMAEQLHRDKITADYIVTTMSRETLNILAPSDIFLWDMSDLEYIEFKKQLINELLKLEQQNAN